MYRLPLEGDFHIYIQCTCLNFCQQYIFTLYICFIDAIVCVFMHNNKNLFTLLTVASSLPVSHGWQTNIY